MDTAQVSEAMGHSSPDFTDLTFQRDNFGLIARYLDDQETEEDIFTNFKSAAVVYGLIAMNWHIMYDKCMYEICYMQLVKNKPKTQQEFDEILSSFIKEE